MGISQGEAVRSKIDIYKVLVDNSVDEDIPDFGRSSSSSNELCMRLPTKLSEHCAGLRS